MELKKILIVEDESMFREFLVGWFRGEGYSEVYEANCLQDADRISMEMRLDLVVLDMDLPDGQGIEYVDRQIRRQKMTRILVLTAHMGKYPVVKLKRSGVMGVLDKGSTSGEELRRAVETLRTWRTYYSERVERTFRELISESTAFYKTLSAREEEMLKKFGLGLSNELVAEQEGLSVSTVQGHRRNVMMKIGVRSSPELIIWAIRNGFVNGTQIERGEGYDVEVNEEDAI